MSEGGGSARAPRTPGGVGPVILIYWVVFFLAVAETGVQLLVPPYLSITGVATASVGFLMAILAAGRLGSRLAGAHLYGRESRRGALLVVLAAASLSALPFAVTLPHAAAGLVLFVHGLAYGLATTMTLALCMESIRSPADAAGVMGWYTGFTSGGHFVGAFAAGYLADHWGMSQSFVVIALTTCIALPLMALVRWPDLVRRGRVVVPRGGHGSVDQGTAGAADVGDEAGSGSPADGRPRLISLVRSLPAPVYLAVLLAFCINFLNQINNAFYPLLALEMGLTLTIVGSLKGAYSAAGTVARLALGVVLKRIDFRRANYVSLVVLAGLTALVPVFTSVSVLLPLFLALGVSRGVLRATSATFAAGAHMTSSRRRGLAAGVYNAGLDLGSILGPVVGGLTVGAFGLRAAFWLPPLALVVPGLILAVRVGRRS